LLCHLMSKKAVGLFTFLFWKNQTHDSTYLSELLEGENKYLYKAPRMT
jgi:hypothetical protein